MASFFAELRVAGRVYPLLRCDYHAFQSTDARGRVNAKVCHSPIELLMEAPRDGFLIAWGANAYKQCAVDIVFSDANGGRAIETLHMANAYCVSYSQLFRHGAAGTGSYVAHLKLTDPAGFTWKAGGGGLRGPRRRGARRAAKVITCQWPVYSIAIDASSGCTRRIAQRRIRRNRTGIGGSHR